MAAAWLLSVVLASGCGVPLSGEYADPDGSISYHFERDGRVLISAADARVVGKFRLDGERVVISSPQGTLVLNRRGDRLIGPMGLELRRRH